MSIFNKKKSGGNYLSGKEIRAIAKENAKVMKELEAYKNRKCEESEYLTEMKGEENILEILSEQDPDLGADLRKRLFTEEDVIGSDDKYIQNYLQAMENRDVAILIVGKSEAFRQKILSNVSKNRGSDILEEESVLGKVTRADSERLTSQFYAVLRRAWEKGDLRVKGRDEDEVFV